MSSVVLLNDPYRHCSEDALEFRLTYDGPLMGASRNDTRSNHKHHVRKSLHSQLFDLWTKNPSLNLWGLNDEQNVRKRACVVLANRFVFNGIGFVPLSWDGFGVACKLDVLMLRPISPDKHLCNLRYRQSSKNTFRCVQNSKGRGMLSGRRFPKSLLLLIGRRFINK